jgi:hypothetical protein
LFTLSSSILLAVSAAHAELPISTAPLFLQSGVQPNIMFVVDDSGSMDFEIVLNEGAPNYGQNDTSLTLNPDWDWQKSSYLICAGVNSIYYNPNKEYIPWVGKDNAGNDYADMDPEKALLNPYLAGGKKTNLKLTVDSSGRYPGYYIWYDHDGDEKFDYGSDIDNNGTTLKASDANGNGRIDKNETEFCQLV